MELKKKKEERGKERNLFIDGARVGNGTPECGRDGDSWNLKFEPTVRFFPQDHLQTSANIQGWFFTWSRVNLPLQIVTTRTLNDSAMDHKKMYGAGIERITV